MYKHSTTHRTLSRRLAALLAVLALLAALAAGSGEARTQAASVLYAYLAQEAPIAPICFKNGSVLTQWGRLSGLSPVRGNIFNRLEGWIIQ